MEKQRVFIQKTTINSRLFRLFRATKDVHAAMYRIQLQKTTRIRKIQNLIRQTRRFNRKKKRFYNKTNSEKLVEINFYASEFLTLFAL